MQATETTTCAYAHEQGCTAAATLHVTMCGRLAGMKIMWAYKVCRVHSRTVRNYAHEHGYSFVAAPL